MERDVAADMWTNLRNELIETSRTWENRAQFFYGLADYLARIGDPEGSTAAWRIAKKCER